MNIMPRKSRLLQVEAEEIEKAQKESVIEALVGQIHTLSPAVSGNGMNHLRVTDSDPLMLHGLQQFKSKTKISVKTKD